MGKLLPVDAAGGYHAVARFCTHVKEAARLPDTALVVYAAAPPLAAALLAHHVANLQCPALVAAAASLCPNLRWQVVPQLQLRPWPQPMLQRVAVGDC
jgi:hypothetical protein